MNDGGTAFPTRGPHRDSEGMTLRDYFAAKAMQAELITASSDATPEATRAFVEGAAKAGHSIEEHLAFNSYLIADAMLKARAK